MKAIVLKEFGTVDNLVVEEVAIPTVMQGEVLVKVKAISINPVDVKLRAGGAQLRGALIDEIRNNPPMILGWDISGEVVEIGNSVLDFDVGDQVFGMVNFVGHGRAYAEYVTVPASHLALKPSNISHSEAAAATLAALTAWQAFVKIGHLKAGDKLLVHASSGGVGHYAVQIAKHLGAYVIGTSSLTNKDFVESLGVDEYIDYQSHKFEEVAKDIDFVLETIGGENFYKSLKLVNRGGTVIVINLPSGISEKEQSIISEKELTCIYMTVESSGSDMKSIASLLEKGIVKSYVSKVFSFEDMAQAHLQIETGHTVGKVIVKL